jgi:uncharacterized protein (DUF58 family)
MYITVWSVVLAALGAVPALLTQSRTATWLWLVGVAVLALLDAWLAPSPTKVGVRREVPKSVRLTEHTSAHLEVVNQGKRRIRGAIRDAWEPSAGATGNRYPLALRAGEVARLTTALTPSRRGDRHAHHVAVRSEGPLRLAGRQRTIPLRDTLRVLPEFASRRFLPSRLQRLREIDGNTTVHLKGAGSEFDSLREYVIGDDVRTIEWRATARRADVVVKTFRPERDRRVFVLLDTSRLSAVRVGAAPRLDASIEASLLLAALAAKAGDRVQVTAFDREERARAAGSSGASVIPTLAHVIAPVEPALVEPDWQGVLRLAQERLGQRALIVLLTTVDTSAVDSGLLDCVTALTRDHLVMIASVADPDLDEMLAGREETHDLYTAGAAARTMLERDAIGMRLRGLGAEVLTALPDDLAPAVADRYLALKASGRL